MVKDTKILIEQIFCEPKRRPYIEEVGEEIVTLPSTKEPPRTLETDIPMIAKEKTLEEKIMLDKPNIGQEEGNMTLGGAYPSTSEIEKAIVINVEETSKEREENFE